MRYRLIIQLLILLAGGQCASAGVIVELTPIAVGSITTAFGVDRYIDDDFSTFDAFGGLFRSQGFAIFDLSGLTIVENAEFIADVGEDTGRFSRVTVEFTASNVDPLFLLDQTASFSSLGDGPPLGSTSIDSGLDPETAIITSLDSLVLNQLPRPGGLIAITARQTNLTLTSGVFASIGVDDIRLRVELQESVVVPEPNAVLPMLGLLLIASPRTRRPDPLGRRDIVAKIGAD